MINSFQSRWS